MLRKILISFGILFFALSCEKGTEQDDIKYVNGFVKEFTINGKTVKNEATAVNVDGDDVLITIKFSSEVDKDHIDISRFSITKLSEVFQLVDNPDPKSISIRITEKLPKYEYYTFSVFKGKNFGLNLIDSYSFKFLTVMDESDKFDRIPSDDLLTLVQEKTFRYFWDYAHPVSGLSRERLGSGNIVTSGGSGFGVMTIPVAIERGFITRDEGAQRMLTIATFLDEKAEKFHGAFSHWIDGETGKAIAFSEKDNGADLVETALLVQGLLAVQQYFNLDNATESVIRQKITAIWEAVEWDWFINSSNALFWHWSPNYGWEMNMNISGWNEALIVYVLAASSPTHPIDKSVYDAGWARNGGMKNGKKFYEIALPLGPDYGGPMFFAHYSFMGLDPRGLTDSYADYWEQNVAHAKINHAYCKANPKGHYGYSERCWGLTASDIQNGYTASSPTNDKGTIAPTAALASMPYTPQESMKALEYFYYVLGDRLFKEYGFVDSFSLEKRWFASSYIAIDQGPIVVMIENHRTGLLWDNFMKNKDVQKGLEKLGFTYTEKVIKI
jgi:hypothetical protein